MVEGDSGSPTWKFTQYVDAAVYLWPVSSAIDKVTALTTFRPCRALDYLTVSLSGAKTALAVC